MQDIQAHLKEDIRNYPKVRGILERVAKYQEQLQQDGNNSGIQHRLGMEYAELGNICERALDPQNGIRLYGMAFQSYNDAIKLDNSKEDYLKSRNILPMLIQDPILRIKMYNFISKVLNNFYL